MDPEVIGIIILALFAIPFGIYRNKKRIDEFGTKNKAEVARIKEERAQDPGSS